MRCRTLHSSLRADTDLLLLNNPYFFTIAKEANLYITRTLYRQSAKTPGADEKDILKSITMKTVGPGLLISRSDMSGLYLPDYTSSRRDTYSSVFHSPKPHKSNILAMMEWRCREEYASAKPIFISKLCICTVSPGYGALRKIDPEEIVSQKYRMCLQSHEVEAKRLETVLYLLTTYFLENKLTPPHVLVSLSHKVRSYLW